jgi:hypothetical protein
MEIFTLVCVLLAGAVATVLILVGGVYLGRLLVWLVVRPLCCPPRRQTTVEQVKPKTPVNL